MHVHDHHLHPFWFWQGIEEGSYFPLAVAADHPHNLLVLQVYHRRVIDLALPDGELVQSPYELRGRL